MLSEVQKKINREEYFKKAINCKSIKLILIGQDPYPDGNDNGIAFCKDDINLLNDKTCLPPICRSLGLNLDSLKKKHKNGISLFNELLEKGITFMNLSYVLLRGLEKESQKLILKEHSDENMNILQQMDRTNLKVVKLGSALKSTYRKYYAEFYSEPLRHPSRNFVIGEENMKKWEEIWSTDYLRKTYLK